MVTQWFELFFLLFFGFCVNFSKGIDTITRGHPIKDPEIIKSTNNTYELGFFSPKNTTSRYVGIWFGRIPVKTVVWVANRDRPLNDSSGKLAISENGNLVLLNGENETIWSTNTSNGLSNSTAQLLDSGNLILFDDSSPSTLWESFKFPTDSLLKNMRLTSDANTNEKAPMKSWKSPSDPTVGRFSAGINPLAVPDLYIWNGDSPYWRSGPWNGQTFIGITAINSGYLDGFNLVDNHNGQYYLTFAYARETTIAYYTLSHNGSLLEVFWNRETGDWETTGTFPENEYDLIGTCGPFGSCNSNDSPICSCLRGYTPKDVEEWDRGNFTSGCVRGVPLQCGNEGFLKMTMMKVPESPGWSGLSEDECRNECLKNCSCLAYSHYEGIGCMSWSNSLVDIQKMSTAGADLYIRVLSSELDDDKKNSSAVIAISVVVGSTIIALCAYLYWRLICKQRGRKKRKELQLLKGYPHFPKSLTEIKLDRKLNHIKLEELPLFKLETLSTATDNFPVNKKLGQGGFGAVYKGKLIDGKEIAVKRLSKSSNQGLEEFMNEVLVISKLQHRNLVRLLGCCIEGEEKMLVYEYMPNKSLDAFLFDPRMQEPLDWSKRWSIIEGIGRGLLYLHRDSRLKIIHRDLKASNILLDEELNPKISDFGMARIFGGTQNQANTQRVVGTYGYMAPEYAMDGQFSEKSDVFSFGVLLLEIVSGRRNTSFYDNDRYLSLLQFVWKMWNDDNAVAIIDSRIASEEFETEILRCIHIGLLCVHEFAVDRPNISTVLSMLSNEVSSLAMPKQPAFTQTSDIRISRHSQTGCSLNGCTITSVQGR